MSASAMHHEKGGASKRQLAYLHQLAHAAWICEGRPGPSERDWYGDQMEESTGVRSAKLFPYDRKGNLVQTVMDTALARFAMLAGRYEEAARHACADASRLTVAIRRLLAELDRLDPSPVGVARGWSYCQGIAQQAGQDVGPSEMDTPTNTLRWLMQCLAVHVRRITERRTGKGSRSRRPS